MPLETVILRSVVILHSVIKKRRAKTGIVKHLWQYRFEEFAETHVTKTFEPESLLRTAPVTGRALY